MNILNSNLRMTIWLFLPAHDRSIKWANVSREHYGRMSRAEEGTASVPSGPPASSLSSRKDNMQIKRNFQGDFLQGQRFLSAQKIEPSPPLASQEIKKRRTGMERRVPSVFCFMLFLVS